MGGFRFVFEFGWKSYFKFTFEIGKLPEPKKPPHRSRDLLQEPNIWADQASLIARSSNVNSPLINARRQRRSLPSLANGGNGLRSADRHAEPKVDDEKSVKECPLFQLPLEIRNMIYKHLLVSSNEVENAARLLDDNQSLLLSERTKLPDIDAAIARTCRLIYEETKSVLYGRNAFVFDSADRLRQFGDLNMNSEFSSPFRSISSNTARSLSCEANRIDLLRNVKLRFRLEGLFTSLYTTDRQKGRAASWLNWQRELFFRRASYLKSIKFKALESLVLDFSRWRLSADEGLMVLPIVAKFEDSSNLQNLTVIGLRHEQTLRQLREGILGDKGSFIVQNRD